MKRLSFILFCCLSACAMGRVGSVYVDSVSDAVLMTEAYHIRENDLMSVLVWNQPKLSIDDLRVRSDGQITLPLVGDLTVKGLTPVDAGKLIAARLHDLVLDPKVTVTMKASQEVTYSVIGQVKTNGTFALKPGMGVLHAIATAGGLTDLADPQSIYVLRKGSIPSRIRFSFVDLSRNRGRGNLFQLRDGDVIVVE